MWLIKLISLFTDKDHKIIRDYLGAAAAIIVLATIGTNLISNYIGSSGSDQLNISTVASNTTGSRVYSEVHSVLDGDIGTSSLTTVDNRSNSKSVLDDEIVTGSTYNRMNTIHLDPCKLQPKN